MNWAAIEPWAKQAWSHKGKPYGMPLEAWTVEVYYNKKLMDELGVKVPETLQLSADGFLDMVKKARPRASRRCRSAAATVRSPARPGHPKPCCRSSGSTITTSCSRGKLPWTDPRVVDTLKWVHSLTEAGLLPTTFTSLKLGESHIYFHTKPGALTFLNGSWYTSRAFNAPDQGGQPVGFPLGI